MNNSQFNLVLSRDRINERVQALAAELSTKYAGTDVLFIGALNGVFIFIADLVRCMTIPISVDFIRVASYGTKDKSCGTIKMTKDIETDVRGRPVVIVEDIADSGLTLDWLKKHLTDRGATSIEICVLINKLERRDVDVQLDYVGFDVESGFLVGYGLDYNGQYRYLPEVYHLVLA